MSIAIPTETAPERDPMLPHIVRVMAARQDLDDVFTLEIAVPEEAELTPFTPGQFNMLTAFGVGEAAISISGPPSDQKHLIHTIRAVGAVSSALTRLQPGNMLGLRGPFGVGWPMAVSARRDVVLIAGGLGLAPLRPALYHLLAERERYEKIVLLYGTRSPEQILFRSELESWCGRLDMEVEVTVDHTTADWHGHVGVVTQLIGRASFDPQNSIAMVCGPEIMMRFSITALRDAGMAEEAIYLSMERNMKCGIGLCGHCQLGPVFVCRDGPVFRYDQLRHLLALEEV